MTGGVLTLRSGRFDGMHSGTLVVAAGGPVEVAGMVNGALVVETGADVHVSGMVNGGIVDRGGSVRVTGIVTG